MKYLKIDLGKVKQSDINTIVDYLRRGQVAVLPTDTIYGLSCIATNKRAVSRINLIKKSRSSKPLIKLVSSINMAKRHCLIGRKQEDYLRKIWPGPVTVILEKKKKLSLPASEKNSDAMRLPKNGFLTTIIRKLRQPIVSTSLNLSGHQALKSIESIAGHFPDHKPGLIVEVGKLKAARPSKIIDIRDISNIKIIRN
jgi:L-threonylcarbamoyladenylate synthase